MEHSPAKSGNAIVHEGAMPCRPANSDYWYALINEEEAAKFAHLSIRTMQGFRYRGGGPRFVCISRRCVKYRRIDLRNWAEAKLRTSTSDSGSEGA